MVISPYVMQHFSAEATIFSDHENKKNAPSQKYLIPPTGPKDQTLHRKVASSNTSVLETHAGFF